MKTTPTTDRNGFPFIGLPPHRRTMPKGVIFGTASRRLSQRPWREQFSIREVLLAAFQELNTHGIDAQVKPQILRPIPIVTTLSVNTRQGVGPNFELKGVRYLGSMTKTEHMAHRIDLAWHQRQTMRTGRVNGHVFV